MNRRKFIGLIGAGLAATQLPVKKVVETIGPTFNGWHTLLIPRTGEVLKITSIHNEGKYGGMTVERNFKNECNKLPD